VSDPREADGLTAATEGTAGTAVLDEAHVGDIKGAFGTIRQHDTEARRSWGARLLTLFAIMGPGLIVMVGDNDAGGVSTYAQAGQNYGLTLLWTLPLLVPVLIVNQEMVVRLGAVTGVGHARLINERFGKFWGAFSVGDLFILNFLTIATEFIGISLALGYFGVSEYISVPIAAVALVVMTATGSFRRWERFMFVFIFANLLVIPLAVQSHPPASAFLHGLTVPGVQGGFNSTSVLLVIAIVGTTVAPWQLFFSSRTSSTSASPRAGSTTSASTPSSVRS
jgi:NRAMP (natural resistance-associated macrophage protein)-like metal ion transporter